MEINFTKKNNVFDEANMGLNKYLAGMDNKGDKEEKGIKFKAEFFTEEDKAAQGFYMSPGHRGGSAGGAGGGSAGGNGGTWNAGKGNTNYDYNGGGGSNNGGGGGSCNKNNSRGAKISKEKEGQKRPLNPQAKMENNCCVGPVDPTGT